MPKVVEIKCSHTPAELRRLAARTKDANQSRRLLSIAAVLDGMSRAEAARIGGMDRQTLRDWAHRFNEQGPAGLKDNRRRGNPRRLTKAQLMDLAALVETGPDRAVHGVVRWRRVDLKALVAERFGVEYHERTIGKLLKHLGCVSAWGPDSNRRRGPRSRFKKNQSCRGGHGHADRGGNSNNIHTRTS
jgi:transposase